MIDKHIVNIGYPRCGTTWLWKHSQVEPRHDKENNILLTNLDFDHYINYFSRYKISANFQTNLWQVDREIIKFVQQCASHTTIIVRNPYDFVERYVDWIQDTQDVDHLSSYIINAGFLKYHDVISRWAPGSKNFKIFFFEDLDTDPTKFFYEYMSFCELPIAKNQNINYTNKINKNKKLSKTTLVFTPEQISYINQEIDKFQLLVERDLSHWKK